MGGVLLRPRQRVLSTDEAAFSLRSTLIAWNCGIERLLQSRGGPAIIQGRFAESRGAIAQGTRLQEGKYAEPKPRELSLVDLELINVMSAGAS
jgi:hypothetical protein